MSVIAETLATAEPSHAVVQERRNVAIQKVTDAVWEQTIGDFTGVCQEQLSTFAKTRWPGANLEPVLFTAEGETVGGCLVMVQQLPLRLGAIAVAKWGPILADAASPGAMATYAGMIDQLVEHYARERRMMLSVMPHATVGPGNPEFEHLIASGFHRGATFGFPNRYIVKLRLTDEAQRKSLEQKWRYHLNKSEKAGLAFEHANVERLAEFDALYEAMTDRKKFPDYSAYGTVPALFAIENPKLRPELFFVRHGDEVVAGAVIFKAGERAVYLYGATTEKALGLRAGYFLHWHIIRWLRDNTAADWYDLGGTDGFQGLHQFKKGMVGSAGVIVPLPPVANYAAYRLPFLAGEAAFAARGLVHIAQRLIDRLRTDRAKPDQKQDAER
jgi:lipid II:glycine glycyltransferase (peptidoglycan interpeptide bridge formation enzyme)